MLILFIIVTILLLALLFSLWTLNYRRVIHARVNIPRIPARQPIAAPIAVAARRYPNRQRRSSMVPVSSRIHGPTQQQQVVASRISRRMQRGEDFEDLLEILHQEA